MSPTTSNPLEERDRLLAEQQDLQSKQIAANTRRREAEAAIPRAQKRWHEALAAKARGVKSAAKNADQTGEQFVLAQTELEAADAEVEAVALAARQVANELDRLHHRDLAAFVAEANRRDAGIRAAGKAARTAMFALEVAWAEADAAWRPLGPAIRTHVSMIDQHGGILRGNAIQNSLPRPLPQQLRDALALLGTIGTGRLTPRPLALEAARRPDPEDEDVVFAKLDTARAVAEVGGEH